MGIILFPGAAYNIQTHFEVEGVFAIKFSPMGANLCLLKEMEEGYINELLGEGSSRWKRWFKEIRSWNVYDVDIEKVMWIRL